MVNRVAGSGEVELKEKLPFRDIVMEADISAEQALNAYRNYLL